MGNINLNTVLEEFNAKKLNSPSSLVDYTNDISILYRDLKLDFPNVNEMSIFKDDSINSNPNTKDIEQSINENAIANSIANWLNTSMYTRLLNPELSINILDYLFEKLDQFTAYFIGLEIMEKLPYYEPRINIEKCDITVDSEYDRLIIELTITIPSLNNKELKLSSILNQTGIITT